MICAKCGKEFDPPKDDPTYDGYCPKCLEIEDTEEIAREALKRAIDIASGNPFSLLDENHEEITKEILKAINLFVGSIAYLKKRYPDVGLGDTETDGAIIAYIYDKIHWQKEV